MNHQEWQNDQSLSDKNRLAFKNKKKPKQFTKREIKRLGKSVIMLYNPTGRATGRFNNLYQKGIIDGIKSLCDLIDRIK